MKRIIVASLISIVGIILSIFLLRPTEWSDNADQERKPIAQVIETHNDVNRQQEGKLIWAPLRQGDIVYLGDKIKTSSLSAVFLLLKESSSRLEIEENSTVLMSGIGKKLTLNMLEGRVFLKQEEQVSTETKVDLVSGGKVLDVKGDVAVTLAKDGSSQVDNFKTSDQNLFEELAPAYGLTVQSSGKVAVNWKPLLASQNIWIEVGESPITLKKDPMIVAGQVGEAAVQFNPGVNYWRLITQKDGQELKSPLMKLNLERPVAPVLISPAESEVIRLDEKGFDLKWTRGNVSDQYTLELSRDSGFTTLVESSLVKNQTFFIVKKDLPEGEYFWRLKDQSKISSFKIIKGEKLLSPVPVSPADGAIFYLHQLQKLDFEWKEQPNVRSYDFTLVGTGNPKTNTLTQNKVSVNLNRIGKYFWSVTSQGPDGKTSILPIKRSFEVREIEKVQWLNAEKKFLYLENYPIIILKWMKNSSTSAALKISDRSDMQGAQIFQVSGADFPFRPSRDGFHYAQILLKDESGAFSGESTIYEFNVAKAPLPPVPEFVVTEAPLKTSTRGELSVRLKNHETSFRTTARVYNKRGSIVDERSFSDDLIHFNALLPGQYFLEAQFMDDYKRTGQASQRLEILVPEKSTIAAPKIKGIKVR